jgi:hypothetical protein
MNPLLFTTHNLLLSLKKLKHGDVQILPSGTQGHIIHQQNEGAVKRGGPMNIKPDSKTTPEEVNLYDYWKVLVKKKKIFLGIFLVPIVIVIFISLSLPHYYKGESEITNTLIPALNIVSLIGNIDDAKKIKIFANNAEAINSVSLSLPSKSTDKINIIVEARTADMIPQALKKMIDYIGNLPEVMGEIAKIQAENDLKTERFLAETDFKIKKLTEARKANLIFLNDITDMIKKRKLTIVNFNPSDLVRKDGDLSLEIRNLEQVRSDVMKTKILNGKVDIGILSPPSVSKHPSTEKIKNIIIFTGLLSFFAGIVVIFFLEYIERMKEQKNA